MSHFTNLITLSYVSRSLALSLSCVCVSIRVLLVIIANMCNGMTNVKCWSQGRDSERTFAQENLEHAPDDLAASLKSVVDDLAGKICYAMLCCATYDTALDLELQHFLLLNE